MSFENALDRCPMCNCLINNSINRLIKEICGHLKCRACLLKETKGCQVCNKLRPNLADINDTNDLKTQATVTEDFNIVYNVSENSTFASDNDSESDKLQIDTDSEPSDPHIIESSSSNLSKSKISRRGKSMYSHIVTKSNEDGKYFECTICKKSFSSRGHRHYHLFCGNVNKPLKCETCNKEFITKFHYNHHLETHQKNPSFKCPKCDRSYLRSNSLRKHLQKHANETKKHVCHECGANFQTSSYLRIHENKHKNILPFACDKCNCKFALKSNLYNHQVVHLNDKKFICDFCGKKFARKGALKLHSSSHSDERPFECKYCNKTFAHQRIYSRHLSIHLGDKKYNCPFCDAKCSRKDNFYRHIRNLHPHENYKGIDQTLIESTEKDVASSLQKVTNLELISQAPGKEDHKSVVAHIKTNKKANNESELESNCTTVNKMVSDGPNSVNVIKSIGNVKPMPYDTHRNHTEKKNIYIVLDKPPSPTSTPLMEYRSEIAKEICQITNQINSTPSKRTINATKQKKSYDPIEIYRKILLSNNHEGVEEDVEKITDTNEKDQSNEILPNPPPIDFSEVHWRKRTSQYFVMKEF